MERQCFLTFRQYLLGRRMVQNPQSIENHLPLGALPPACFRHFNLRYKSLLKGVSI